MTTTRLFSLFAATALIYSAAAHAAPDAVQQNLADAPRAAETAPQATDKPSDKPAEASAHSTDPLDPKELEWEFNGIMGKVDKQSAQRGFQVYKEVCASCHSLKRKAFRSLTEIGFSEAEVKALAATYTYQEVGDDGEMKDRPGRPSDYFKPPFANKQAAAAANGGAVPPDLSLIIKARHDGANYVYSLLTGYTQPPADVKLQPGLNYNPYFPGHQIAMPQPLNDGQVTYEDGTTASVDQMSKDVVNFLQWAAEPEMEHRKEMGIRVMIFLAFMTGFFFFAYKRVWKNIH